MNKALLKKTVVAVALATGLVYTSAVFAAPDAQAKTTAVSTSQAQINKVTKKDLTEWVQGLQAAFPYYRFELKDYVEKEDRVSASILFSMGNATQENLNDYSSTPYFALEYKLDIEHGLAFENRHISIARVKSDIDFTEDSPIGAQDLLLDLKAALKDIKYEGTSIIKPSGEFYSAIRSTESYIKNDDDGLDILIPSFNASLETYQNKELVKYQVNIPTVRIVNESYFSEVTTTLYDIELTQTDKPIRNQLYSFNGKTNAKLGKLIVQEDDKNLTVNNVIYSDESHVDSNGLYQAQAKVSFNGTETLSSSNRGDETPIANKFDVKMAGTIENIDVKSYLALMDKMINSDPSELFQNFSENEPIFYDLLKAGPKINVPQIEVVLNGHKGNFTADASVLPFTAEDEGSNIAILLVQKLRVNATMDIPIEWFSVFEPDETSREKALNRFISESNGYILQEKNRLKSTFSYKGGNMTVNGKPLNIFDNMF